MFSNLVESGSHAADFKRRGSFFAGALAFYALLLAAAGVGSVYAFNARLDEQSDYEIYAILRFQPPAEERAEPERPDQPRPAAANRTQQLATRPEISINTPYKGEQIADASTKEVKARTAVVIAPFTSDPPPGGLLLGPATPGGPGPLRGSGDGPRVVETAPPPAPPVRPTPTPAPPQKPDGPLRLTTHVINSKAVNKPIPPYPPAARAARIQGLVSVSILVDEQGRVVSAKATSGNPLLHLAAVQAARQARFTPTILNGQPVRVTGVITYNFTLE